MLTIKICVCIVPLWKMGWARNMNILLTETFQGNTMPKMSWSDLKVKDKRLEMIRYFHHDSASLPKILIEQNQEIMERQLYPKCLVRRVSSLGLIHSLFTNPFHSMDVNRCSNTGLFTWVLASGKNLSEHSWGERQPEPKECIQGVPG